VLLLLLRGKILPATSLKLVRIVKLRLQIGVVSRETRKFGQKWTSNDLHVSGRPYEGGRQYLNPGFFLVVLYLPRIPLPERPSDHLRQEARPWLPVDARVDSPVL